MIDVCVFSCMQLFVLSQYVHMSLIIICVFKTCAHAVTTDIHDAHAHTDVVMYFSLLLHKKWS